MPTSDIRNAPNNIKFRSIEKFADDTWITSGNFGSRDAVLVFRTDILNSCCKKVETQKESETSLIPEAKLATRTNSCVSIFNLSSALPSTSKKGSSSIEQNTNTSENSEENEALITIQTTYTKKVSPKKTALTLKKHLHYSHSSSDVSISSECEDDIEGENITSKCNNRKQTSVEGVESMSAVYNGDNDVLEVRDETGEDRFQEDGSSGDCAYNENMPAFQFKITYKFLQTETKLLRKIFVRHGLSEVQEDGNFSILWTGVHMKPDILRNLAPYQRVNHFPRSYELTRKDRMYKNIERMQHLRGFKHFDIVPQSFILPLEYRDLVSAHNKHRGPWIVKPAASSRGRGIFIVNTPDQIPQDEQGLVSKYIADPLCIDGHKCDLRVYVLVTSFDPLLIYIYEEGLVRLATVKYDRNADNLWNPCMHLCNYSINKYHSDYIKSNDAQDEDVGHKWTLSALIRHLKSQGCDTQQLMLHIEDLIIKAILSCAQSIISACRMFVPSGNNCFELYGFDILIDDSLKPWLLEVNLSPSMGVDSPLDAKVKSCLIVDLLTCIGIPAYSPSMRAHYDKKWTRFHNVNYTRRTTSADSGGHNFNSSRRTSNVVSNVLTLEEQRIIRNARQQLARRGGFVRIFPTEDSMQRYGNFLDPATGVPLSTPIVQGQISFAMILPHNYNQMLFNNLYGKDARDKGSKDASSLEKRIYQYERALETASPIVFVKKPIDLKCVEEGKRLRKQILKMIDGGNELTQLQARRTFSLYLESILRRLTMEPRDYHEKLILKFLNRVGGAIKAPVFFRNPQNIKVINKARSAMVAKLLGDYLEQYKRDTEAYVDSFDHFGMIPTSIFNEFLTQAQETDLESVLALHTNLTGNMPYLYNRCGLSVPPTPPIPSGIYGFLKAMPSMVLGGAAARDFNKHDGYFKIADKDLAIPKCEKLPDVACTNKKNCLRR